MLKCTGTKMSSCWKCGYQYTQFTLKCKYIVINLKNLYYKKIIFKLQLNYLNYLNDFKQCKFVLLLIFIFVMTYTKSLTLLVTAD